jgi:hypothetical protein
VCDLEAERAPHRVHEIHDAGPGRRLLVVPQPGVLSGDAALLGHCDRFGHHQSEAALGAGAEVREVPVVRDAVLGFAGVLAHRRQPDPVPETDVAKVQWLEQQGHIDSPSGRRTDDLAARR